MDFPLKRLQLPGFHQHELAADIDSARFHQFMKDALPHLIGGLITSSLVLYIYFDYASITGRWIWASCMLLMAVSVIINYGIYYTNSDRLTLKQWRIMILGVSGIWGLCWAVASSVFLGSAPDLYVAIMLLIICSMATAPAPALVHYPIGYLLFITPPLIGIFIHVLSMQQVGSDLIRYLPPFLWFMLLGYGWNLHITMINAIKLRLENRQAWQKAEQANIAKSKFLASASHDIRQPLQATNFFLAALKNQQGNQGNEQLFERLESSVDSMSELLNSLLDVSRLDAQVITPQPRHIPLLPLLNKLSTEIRSVINNRPIEVIDQTNDVTAYADPVLLERIISNLLSNAARYTEAGTITLSNIHTDGHISISVSDTGIGIPEEEQQSIFMEFHQLNNPERDRQKGLGLGLSIVKRLCDLQSWPLTLSSTPGSGSCFTIQLPVGDPAQVQLEQPKPAAMSLLNDVHIMIIDDDVDVRDSLGSLLQSWGCHIATFDDVYAAIASLQAGKTAAPQLLISDYRLRENTTGVSAVKAIQTQLTKPIPAILITGDTDPQRLQDAKSSGLTLLHKPVKPAQLRKAIQKKLKNT